MNRSATYFSLFLILTAALLLPGACKNEFRTRTYHTRVPVVIAVSTMRQQVIAVQAPKQLSVPGKIYVYGDYLFIGEVNKGIHIVNNTNPAKPRFINFISIPGNADMAVNNHVLYADNYVDLLAFDISDPTNIKPAKRVEDVFDNFYNDKIHKTILTYKDTVIVERIRDGQDFNMYYDMQALGNMASQSYGTGGSTARFTLMNSNLYTIDQYQLKLFDVSAPKNPKYSGKVTVGWGIETIFPYENKLFIGSTNGLHIYDATNPAAPVKLSTYQHVTSCDPVVVQGKYAYVTLRSGNFCRQGVNVLEVLDIHDPSNPVLVSSFPMLNPHGLSISKLKLFICEGQYGLKAFDSSDILTVGKKQLSFLSGIDAVDVITGPKSLIVTGKQGIYQYYSNPSSLKQVSHLTLSEKL